MTNRLCATHVVARLDPANGGLSYSVPRLCEALAAAGAETMVLSVAVDKGGRCEVWDKGYRDCRCAWNYARIPVLRRLRSSQALSDAVRIAARTGNVIHNHGLWLMPNISAARAAAVGPAPLVISPRGMLAPAALAFSRLKKQIFWTLLQGPAIRAAACLHATCEQEYEEIRGLGLVNPVAIIPNGIDVPELPGQRSAEPTAERIVLSLGRLHPLKGLVSLVHAWARVERGHPGWHLRIIGPSEAGHADQLRRLVCSLGLTRVSIKDQIYGDAKARAYRDADVFVLPSLNENFGLTVAEALASATPVISTKGAPWAGLESQRCGWWIDHGVEPLAAALAQAMELPRGRLRAMGDRGRQWVARDFAWDRIARNMLGVYHWLARGAEPPSTVRFD